MYSKKEVVELFNEFEETFILNWKTEINEFLKEKGLIEEIEEGWYTNVNSKTVCIYFDKNKKPLYGIGGRGYWYDELTSIKFNDNNVKMTPQEVEEALKKEAKRRGFKEGVLAKCLTLSSVDKLRCIDDANFYPTHNALDCPATIFKDGKWAEIIQPKEIVVDGITYVEKN